MSLPKKSSVFWKWNALGIKAKRDDEPIPQIFAPPKYDWTFKNALLQRWFPFWIFFSSLLGSRWNTFDVNANANLRHLNKLLSPYVKLGFEMEGHLFVVVFFLSRFFYLIGVSLNIIIISFYWYYILLTTALLCVCLLSFSCRQSSRYIL